MDNPNETIHPAPETESDDASGQAAKPIGVVASLEEILSEAGDDVRKLFGIALSIFAGPNAISQTEEEKGKALEAKILNP